MNELLAVYADASPGVAASICFLLGLVFGSFSSVLSHRLPRGESIVGPRSCCPQCRHVLGPAELVPVLSYIWLRGRCRHCVARISWRYPALELLCGGLGLSGALVGGLAVGLTALLVWTVGHVGYGVLKRRAARGDQIGTTLVEVLVAGLLLSTVSASVLGFVQATMRLEQSSQRQAVLMKLGREALTDVGIKARATPLTLDTNQVTQWNDCPIINGDKYLVGVQTTPNNHLGAGAPESWDVRVQVNLNPGCDPLMTASLIVMKGVVTRGP